MEDITLTSKEISSMNATILDLMRVSGEYVPVDFNVTNKSLFQMLEAYRTGTQGIKEWNRAPSAPKPEEIGPIDTVLDFDSPERKAKVDMKLVEEKNNHDWNEES